MKTIRWTTRTLAAAAALAAFVAAAPAGAAEFYERAEAFPKPADVLPKPGDLGAGWAFPWERTKEIDEKEWRSQFDSDPRLQALRMKSELELLTDQEFEEAMEGFAGLLEALNQTGSALGKALTAGGEIPGAIRTAKPTRQQLIDDADATIRGIHAFAHNDYSREKPIPGREAGALGIVPTWDDSIDMNLTVYTDEYLASHKVIIDIGGEALAKLIAVQKETEKQIIEAMEDEAKSLEEHFDTLAHTERTDSEEAKEVLKSFAQIAQARTHVEGKLLSGGDSGYMVWLERTRGEDRSVTVTGQIRRGNGVVAISRLATGTFVDGAVEDTRKILFDMAKRMEPYAQ